MELKSIGENHWVKHTKNGKSCSIFPENHVVYKVVKTGRENIFWSKHLKEKTKYFQKVSTVTLKAAKQKQTTELMVKI